MEASYNNQVLTNPRVEGWLQDFNQQDFRQGAKELNSLHPVSSPSIFTSSSTYNEWMELQDTLGCNELEAFNDVLLPETKEDFGPDFFNTLENSVFIPDIFDADLSSNNYHYGTDDKFLINNPEFAAATKEKPKITTIKLKKVKVPKNKQLHQNFQVCDYEVSIPPEPEGGPFFDNEMDFTDSSPKFVDNNSWNTNSSPIYADNNLWQDDSNTYCDSFIKDEIDKLLSDDDIEFNNLNEDVHRTEITSDVLTLKEAINMENADSILDAYLSPERSSFSLGSPKEQSINVSLLEDNIFSPGTSQSSYSEGVPSPSSSLDYSFSDMTLIADSQILPNSESSTSTSNEKTTRRGRKPRQKMTAESKYLRKKEQNKQAALRYRAKKKQEDEQLMQTLSEEENRNTKLKKEWKNLNQEMKFMKKLLKESLVARNLVPLS